MTRRALAPLLLIALAASMLAPSSAFALCTGSDHLFTFQVWSVANKVSNARVEVYLDSVYQRPADNLLTTQVDDAQGVTNGNGEATMRLAPGTYYVLVIANGYSTLQTNASVPAEGSCGATTYSLNPAAPTSADAAQSSVSLSFGSIPADSVSTSTLTIVARNQYGSVMQSQAVSLANTMSGLVIRPNTTSTDLQGVATWDITGFSIGTAILTPSVGSITLKPVSLILTNPADSSNRAPVGTTTTGPGVLSPNTSQLRLESNPAVPDGVSKVAIIVEAKDTTGASLQGRPVTIRIAADGVTLNASTGMTDAFGKVTFHATALTNTSGYVSAIVDGVALEDRPVIRFEPRTLLPADPITLPPTTPTAPTSPPISISSLAGKLVKLKDDGNPQTTEDTTVYYVSRFGKRHPFSNPRIFASWFADFRGVISLTAAQLAELPLGSAATYFPGKQLIKFPSDPKVYAVVAPNVLRWITTEELARAFHGTTWAEKVHDLNEAFATQYNVGGPLTTFDGYTPAAYLNTIYSLEDVLRN